MSACQGLDCDEKIRQLRELNAELLAALKLVPSYRYCLPEIVVELANKAITKAEKLSQ